MKKIDSSSITKLNIDKLFGLILGNAAMIYGFLTFPYFERYKTVLWGIFVEFYTGLGITAGAHRYWSHRSYKANLPLRMLLGLGYYTSCQMPLEEWVRNHRVHHKYTETDADPHNSMRGFFFAHVGWVVLEKHPDANEKLKQVDISDLKADSVAVFGDKYYTVIQVFLQLFTMSVPVYCWNEEWYYATLIQLMRWMFVIHISSCVNSFAHLWGYKPYDRNIGSVDNNILTYFTYGEGWHNYHHTFPYDYRTSEFSGFIKYDPTAMMIKFFQKIGWAYDLKVPSDALIRMTVAKRGDASLVRPY